MKKFLDWLFGGIIGWECPFCEVVCRHDETRCPVCGLAKQKETP